MYPSRCGFEGVSVSVSVSVCVCVCGVSEKKDHSFL